MEQGTPKWATSDRGTGKVFVGRFGRMEICRDGAGGFVIFADSPLGWWGLTDKRVQQEDGTYKLLFEGAYKSLIFMDLFCADGAFVLAASDFTDPRRPTDSHGAGGSFTSRQGQGCPGRPPTPLCLQNHQAAYAGPRHITSFLPGGLTRPRRITIDNQGMARPFGFHAESVPQKVAA
jgi:hypothetical protein